jgi:predicted secreted protein
MTVTMIEKVVDFPDVQYCVEVGASSDGPVVQVTFDGFADTANADYFARYILEMLVLNTRGSPSGYVN